MRKELVVMMTQTNPGVTDMMGNLAQIEQAALKASAQGATLVVFGEGALWGVVDEGGLQVDHTRGSGIFTLDYKLAEVSKKFPGQTWILNYPMVNNQSGVFEEGFIVMKNGVVSSQALKTDSNERIGLDLIDGCRVAIRFGSFFDNRLASAVTKFKPDFIVALHTRAELPFSSERTAMGELAEVLSSVECPVIAMSIAGGFGTSVYVGQSFAAQSNGKVVARLKGYVADHAVVKIGLDGELQAVTSSLEPDLGNANLYERVLQQGVASLRDYAAKAGLKKMVVGISGGLDSAICLVMAAYAVGPENVMAISMPSKYSSQGSIDDSDLLCVRLGVERRTVYIDPMVQALSQSFEEGMDLPVDGLALENLQSRARAVILLSYSNKAGAMVINTGNKSEEAMGYCTLGGDNMGALAPLSDIYKTESYELARHINLRGDEEVIPDAILTKKPSAELSPGQVDEDSLPPYPVLDAWLKVNLNDFSIKDAERKVRDTASTLTPEQVSEVKRRLVGFEFKRRVSAPPVRMRNRGLGVEIGIPMLAHVIDLK